MGPVTAQSEDVARARPRARRGPARSGSPHHVPVRRIFFGVVIAVVAVFLLAVLERVLFAGDVMPAVEVDGVTLGGTSEDEAYAELSALAAELETAPLEATAGDHEFVVDASLLGVEVDEYETLRAARRAGRSDNPVDQTVGAVLRRFRPDTVALRVTYREDGLEGILDGWQREIIAGDIEGGLQFEGTEVVEIQPAAGNGLIRDEARAILIAELQSPERDKVDLPVGPVQPVVSAEEVTRAAAEARALLRGTHQLSTFGATLTITPEQLVSAMGTRIDDDTLAITLDPDLLRAALGDSLSGLETEPVDATFSVTSSNTVQVVPSQAGRQVDMALVTAAILDGEREIVAPVEEKVPAHDTAWAESLGIKEQVSTFTTRHASGQSRVTNIHLAADFLDNSVIEPGATFSLNEAIGPRTPDRGFVTAPVFYGEFTEDFGGGVSQLATTFFNAIFFGGYEDIYHKPHTIYISRYPMGREATVNYGTVDVTFRNNSNAGILVRTSYDASSITVSFYGDKEGKTVTEADRKILEEIPVGAEFLQCPQPLDVDTGNACATLEVGALKQIEAGYPGISVEFYRVIERPGAEPERERFSWRYRMTPNRILVGATPPTTTVPPVTAPPDTSVPTTVVPPETPAAPPP